MQGQLTTFNPFDLIDNAFLEKLNQDMTAKLTGERHEVRIIDGQEVDVTVYAAARTPNPIVKHKASAHGARLSSGLIADIRSGRTTFMQAEDVPTRFDEQIQELNEHFGHVVEEDQGPDDEELKAIERREIAADRVRKLRVAKVTNDINRFLSFFRFQMTAMIRQKMLKAKMANLARKQRMEIKAWKACRWSLSDRQAWLEPHPMDSYETNAIRIMAEKNRQPARFYRIPSNWSPQLLKSKGFRGWIIDLEGADRTFRVAAIMGFDTLGEPIIDRVLMCNPETVNISWDHLSRALSKAENVERVFRVE